jgi:hypothetical protein
MNAWTKIWEVKPIIKVKLLPPVHAMQKWTLLWFIDGMVNLESVGRAAFSPSAYTCKIYSVMVVKRMNC